MIGPSKAEAELLEVDAAAWGLAEAAAYAVVFPPGRFKVLKSSLAAAALLSVLPLSISPMSTSLG